MYQRYFLKMNQSNMTNLISLLLLLCVGFLMVAATDFVLPRHADGPETSKIQTGSDRLDKLLVLMCTTGCCIAIYAGKTQNRCCSSKRLQLNQNCTIFYVPMGIYFFYIHEVSATVRAEVIQVV